MDKISIYLEGALGALLMVLFGALALIFILRFIFSKAKKHIVLGLTFAILSFLMFEARIYLTSFLESYVRPMSKRPATLLEVLPDLKVICELEAKYTTPKTGRCFDGGSFIYSFYDNSKLIADIADFSNFSDCKSSFEWMLDGPKKFEEIDCPSLMDRLLKYNENCENCVVVGRILANG